MSDTGLGLMILSAAVIILNVILFLQGKQLRDLERELFRLTMKIDQLDLRPRQGSVQKGPLVPDRTVPPPPLGE